MAFINTTYTDAVKSFVDTNKQIIKNPLALFDNKKPTIADYINTDINVSTLDEASGLEYANTGKNSPIKYNIIEDALLFGIGKIEINLSGDETGIGTDDITGDAYILPNTFVPYPGDFFRIKYLKEKILFKVTEVQTDTLDTGANYYKISYKLDKVGQDEIDKIMKYNIHNRYKMITSTVGTNFKSVILSSDYDKIEKLETVSLTLKEYYKQLFFDSYIQTFSYLKDSLYHFYDPFLIEFLKRNNLMAGTAQYTYVDQAMSVWSTFGIDYDRTIFRAIELRDTHKADKCAVRAIGLGVNDTTSLMSSRLDQYYYVDYNIHQSIFLKKFDVIPNDLVDHIVSGEKINDPYPAFYNIIIDYFKDGWDITTEDIDLMDDITMKSNEELFYGIPILIYILECKVNDVMADERSIS